MKDRPPLWPLWPTIALDATMCAGYFYLLVIFQAGQLLLRQRRVVRSGGAGDRSLGKAAVNDKLAERPADITCSQLVMPTFDTGSMPALRRGDSF